MERDFHHPYEPYDIQTQFMNAVYECLEGGKVGIFESPTGTGKSLSLICGSLTWLRDHKRRTFEDGLAVDEAYSDEPPWLLDHARKQKKQVALQLRAEFDARIAKIKQKEKRLKEMHHSGESRSKRQKTSSSKVNPEYDEDRFVLDDYASDQDDVSRRKTTSFNESGLSLENQALMEKMGLSRNQDQYESEVPDGTKIFFCSRTHSQLTQFASELRRVQMPPSVTPESTSALPEEVLVEEVKHLTLGSRKNLCINPKVNKLNNPTAINERCLELQQSGVSADCRCPFMPNTDNQPLVNEFRDHTLAAIRDIEDLGLLGKRLGICPYYASRSATKYAEVVTLPYPLLLQKTARDALDLSLKDHVVVIDEAHNLMDAIAGIYSVSVTLDQVQQARTQVTAYLMKFRDRLKGKNRVYVAQIVRILDSIISYLQSKSADVKATDGSVDMSALMSGKGVDQIDIYKLSNYLQESRLARKVDGYTTYSEQTQPDGALGGSNSAAKKPVRHTVPVLTHVQSFLVSLMNPSAEGRFFFSREETGITLKYMLLDPTFHFRDIVEDARAVVLAGGTMSPMSDYEQHLLPYLDPSKLMTLSCGHVIPPSNLLAVPVIRTSGGQDFDFTFEKRNTEQMLIDLGRAILAVAQHVPDGVVVFIPSYSYLDVCVDAWKRLRHASTPTSPTIWEAFLNAKPIFLEQRSQSQSNEDQRATKESTVDSVLSAYSSAIASGGGRGALLFAVIGGSLSEGINFSDSLGRGVVVVGLPFPNPHSAEWKAKMEYISSKATSNGQDGKAAARDYYENACMRAVNQCVGRAIRHKNDYAAIFMLDRRYAMQRIQAKLPGWIRKTLATGAGVRELEGRLDDFFAGKKATI